MRQENHFYKVIDEKTILIAADTPANRKTYEDLVIRTFFLSNGGRHGGLQRAAVAPPDDADLDQQGGELDHAARHGGQGRHRREDHRAERQAARRGRRRRRAAADQHDQDAGHRAAALPRTARRRRSPAPGGKTDFGADNLRGDGSFTWDQLRQLSLRSFGFTIPLGDVLVHQEQHGRRAARQAPAPHLGGAEGAAHHRRQGPDSRPRRSIPGRRSAATSSR